MRVPVKDGNEEYVLMTCKQCGRDFLWVHPDGLCALCYALSFPEPA